MVAAALALAVSACGGDTSGQRNGDGTGTGGETAGGPGAAFAVHLTISGHLSGTATYSDLEVDEKCGRLAAKDAAQTTFSVPMAPDQDIPVSGHTVDVSVGIERFVGPGSYGNSSFSAGGAQLTIDQADDPAVPITGSTSQAVVHADGSGTFDFNNYGDPQGNRYSGHLSWTCTDT